MPPPIPNRHRQTARLRRFLGLVGLCWLTCLAAAADGEKLAPPLVGRPLAERGTLVVGVTTDNYPFGYLGPNGEWTGFASDLLDAAARVMQLRIKRVEMPSEELRTRFRNGDFDFLQLLTQTPEREKYAEFTVPYLILQGTIFVQKRGHPIKTFDDLKGRKFALIGVDTIASQFLRERGLTVDEVMVGSIEQGLRLVDSGQCDAVYGSHLTALAMIERYGLRNIAPLGTPIENHDLRYCFALHKGDAQLLARLNEGLAILHRTGEFDKIYARWFGKITAPLISRQQVVTYGMVFLALALFAALWGLQHQRKLRRRITGQAAALTLQTAELTRQAAELAGQKALLQALYDNIPMSMCVLDFTPAGFHILSVNRQAETFFGLAADQVTGRLLAELPQDSECISHLTDLLQRGLTSRTLLREERRFTAANKRLIFTLVPMTPDAAGHPRLCVLAEDITERRNLDDEIAQSRKLRAVGELVGGIAHEFNNLLTPIMLKVGQIQLDRANDTALLDDTRLIAEAVQRSAELTQRLLTFGRKTDRNAQEVRLGTIINDCFALLRLTMDRRILWEQAVSPDLPPIYFSATDLNQIILNLIINARDTLLEKLAHQRGDDWTPVIRVEAKQLPIESMGRLDGTPSLRQIRGWQRLTIRDNGMGMTPEVRERIFEPFFTTKDVGKGTGLGLATVWHLVTEVSGRIEVESTPGQGTAFHVTLPMLPPPAHAAAPTKPAQAGSGPARIFLAEDDQLVASTVLATLKRGGHTAVHFSDGAVGWEHLQAHLGDYDLLLLDINMPGLDGIELAQRVRATGRYQGRIMIASGRLSSDDLEQIAAARVDCVLSKPFAVAELLEAVRKSLHSPDSR